MDTKIGIGDRVRSFDFAESMNGERFRDELTGERAAFVEGVVTGFRKIDGCERYVIRVERDVFRGEERMGADSRVGTEVFPPVNGTPKLLGEPCCGVDLIAEAGPTCGTCGERMEARAEGSAIVHACPKCEPKLRGESQCNICGARIVDGEPGSVPVCCDDGCYSDGSHDAPVCLGCCSCPSAIKYQRDRGMIPVDPES